MSAAPIGHFCWPELFTSDLGAAQAFYAKRFGWSWRAVPSAGGNYVLAMLGEDPVAGLFQAPASMGPPRWNSYVQVGSADDAAVRAKALGGSVTAGPFDVNEVGRMAFLADPAGAAVALWQSGSSVGATRFGVAGSLAWTELATPAVESSTAFYAALFGWEPRPRMDLPRPYVELFLAGRGVGGILPTSRTPGAWMPYFQAPDPATSAAEALADHARIVVPATDLPSVGTFSILEDLQGARFGLLRLEP